MFQTSLFSEASLQSLILQGRPFSICNLMLGGHSCYDKLSTFFNTGKVSLNVASHARLR